MIHSLGTLMWIILSNKLTTTIKLLQLCKPFWMVRLQLPLLPVNFLSFEIWHSYLLAPKYVLDSLVLLQKRSYWIIANMQYIRLHLISTMIFQHYLFGPNYFNSLSGYRIFHGLCPKYFFRFFFRCC